MEANISNAEIIAEFKKKRTRQIMAVGPIILAFIGLLSVENNPTHCFRGDHFCFSIFFSELEMSVL
jgi:hypothetical protein